MKPKYLYPLVECDHHPGPQFGYCVCKHITDEGAQPAFVDPATTETPGAIICNHPSHARRIKVKDLTLVCEGCARDRGWIKEEHELAE